MSLLSPQLEAFQSVAQTKTVHGAAKALGLTQTGVTQRIRTLEGSLGTSLFVRSRRGMLLTTEGQALLCYCLASRDLEGPVLAQIQHGGQKSTVQVAVTGPTSIMRSRVVPQTMGVLKKFPELLLHYHISDEEHWVDDLRTGVAQIAILPPELVVKELDSKMLKAEKYVLVGPKSWKARTIIDIVKNERIIDFSPDDQASFRYLKKFKLIEHVRPERHFLNNNECLAQLIEAGLGYGVLTQEFAERFLQHCGIILLNEGKVLEQPMAMAWFPKPVVPDYWKALVSSVQ